MALNIKKPNYINTSAISNGDYSKTYKDLKNKNKEHPFVLFKDLMEDSWVVKNEDLKVGEEQQLIFENKKDLNITVDSLKNKSLITYIDAPWGSGKTHFVEGLINWIKGPDKNKNKDEIKFKFSKSENNLNISLIDSWEVYKSKNIEEIFKNIYEPELDEEFDKLVKENKKNIDKNKVSKKKELKSKIHRYLFIANSFLKFIPSPVQTSLILAENAMKNKKQILDDRNEFLKKYNNIEIDILTKSIKDSIELKFKENNNFIIIDNIERLSSKNRLDVINKVVNSKRPWAATQVGYNRTNNFSYYLRFFIENSEFLKLSQKVII
ncbi:MAG: hypothetical protein HRS50_02515, partial [Mycoplasmataceae bacterium]|nr:hypothetical protein [Mycoplasmataceae bacterium]